MINEKSSLLKEVYRINLRFNAILHQNKVKKYLELKLSGKINELICKKLQYKHHVGTQVRSQDFAKGGGGLFWKFVTTAIELDPNFHQS